LMPLVRWFSNFNNPRSSLSSLPQFHRNFLSFRSFSNFSTNSSDNSKVLRIVLIGVPGSGKGTQSAKIERDYGVLPISTGHLLRTAVSEGTPLGKIAQKQMIGGGLVADDIMLSLIKHNLNFQAGKSWLLDGFPRNVTQAKQLDTLLEELKQPLSHVFYLKVSEEVIYDRLKERLVHVPSGRVYNTSFNPPKVDGLDDITGEPLTKREDDNIETVRARLDSFHRVTSPLLLHYEAKGALQTIDSPTSDIGYVAIKKILDKATKS